MVIRDGGAEELGELTAADATTLLAEAVENSAAMGLPWRDGELLLRPSNQLAELVRRSRAHASAEAS